MKRWLVAAGCSIGLAVGFGPIFVYSFGLFQKPMIAELGWSRGAFSLGFSFATLLTAILNTAVGALIDRKGVRPVAIAGTILMPLVLVGFGLVRSYPAFLAMAVGMGLVGATTSYPTYIPALPPWFKTRLGLAFSIAAAGVGVGAAVWAAVISGFLARFGWRGAFDALAVTVLVIGLANALILIRDAPRAVLVAERAIEARKESVRLFSSALRSATFWRFAVAFALIPLVGIGINFHFAAMLTDRGFSGAQVAAVLGLQGTAIVAGRMGAGVVLDYVSTRMVGLVLFGGQAVAVIILLSGAGGAAPYLAAALLGLATGGEGDLMPFVLSRRYGEAAYGKIYSACFALFNVGTLLGPIAMGTGFDRFGSYAPVLIGFLALSLTSTTLIFLTAGGRPAPQPRPAASIA